MDQLQLKPKIQFLLMALIDFFSASSKVVNNKAAAPSFIPEEFPGVTVPFFLKTVFNFSKSEILNFFLDVHLYLK